MSIKKQIDILAKLQNTAAKISKLEINLQGVARRIEKLDEQRRSYEDKQSELQTELDEFQKKYRSLEADAKMNHARAAKSQERLGSVKTNKEYQSILKEIDEIKKLNSRVEDEMLQCLELIDAAKQAMTENQDAYKQIEAQIRSEKEAIEAEAQQDRNAMESLQTEWRTIALQADPVMLKQYNQTAQRSNGLAVVAVTDAVCQGCNMNIPPQMYNELHRFDSLMFCPHCQRIIYLKTGE
jgi:predicted  nucleic acid-binding Zn-ribbon protein